MDELIDELVAREWEMFSAVNAAGGPRAACQDNPETFGIMRRAQFAAWSNAALESYRDDLETAKSQGRNLIMEKYARMMESTFPDEYAKIAPFLPPVSDEARMLAEKITACLDVENKIFKIQYPRFAKQGRPTQASEDSEAETSIETYQLGELMTYSETTLRNLLSCIEDREFEGGSTGFVKLIYEYTVSRYGYSSIDEAERVLVQAYADELLNSGYENCSCQSLHYDSPAEES